MALELEHMRTLDRLGTHASTLAHKDELMDRYYNGSQRLQVLGLAVPPALRRFETSVNWPRLVVDSLEARLDVKTFYGDDGKKADAVLEGWAYNNLDSEASLAHIDALVYGRSYVCVGRNPDDPKHPLVTVESPRQITVAVDPQTRKITAALRLYGGLLSDSAVDPVLGPQYATLYLPEVTIWLRQDAGKWVVTDRDDHRLGVVPIVALVNRRRAGDFVGTSEMVDTIPLTDAAARTLTNLQVGQETNALPGRWAVGVSKGDFVDADGKPLPVWESYFTAISATVNKDAKFGQFTATDLKNFHDTVDHYAKQVASVSRMPAAYVGITTSNPASADAIRSAEAPHVKLAERKQRAFGDAWGWVAALYERFRTGSWENGNAVRTEWHDAATPTTAARADATVKLSSGKSILSVEGAWDELGWSEARKDTERERLQAESAAYFDVPRKPLNTEVSDDVPAGAS